MNLQFITAKDIHNETGACLRKSQKMLSDMRKQYGKKDMTRLHLNDYLGINDLLNISVVAEIMNPKGMPKNA